jgi:clan AA aspartic protease
MIIGRTNHRRQGIVLLHVQGPAGTKEVEAIVDTGFTGYLSIPPEIVDALNLPVVDVTTAELADGNDATFFLHRATVLFGGTEESVVVYAAGGRRLMGMALLDGWDLCIQVREGGEVRVEPL